MAKMVNSALDCIRKSTTGRSKEVIISLCSAVARPHLEWRVQVWAPQYKRYKYTRVSLVKGH